ncbi:DNA excision repair protein ERCC-1 [Babesia sp. Xinjiang]|uniref:DNA excision repair protein ERCC-1 n=1 Tax=Babesia sp. Xinjiang TaxID=462227 RepID=UPI000A24C022|nr:DNA excision repair protein ERCC-1 [Babesia sp. Xinjiang]XP_028872096.1 DNA excision repair protein ERCC-1 [Babesia sp. Xinjiang]ORM41580.1 DNA excision repair protein ERCC-1 [Babesia sp. Xinjiang]ORM41640.1 DNA excision repair protein ERCC-1 [Babesia sp. Xinjiang]
MDSSEPVAAKEHCIVVSSRQRGNPLIKHLTNVTWVEGETQYDYKVTDAIQVLFLSLKYHRMHRGYIVARLKHLRSHKVKNPFIICQVDIPDPQDTIEELTVITFTLGYRILLSWSARQSAALLEILRIDGRKGLEFLNRKEIKSHMREVQEVISSVRRVNNTDAAEIVRRSYSFKQLIHAKSSQFEEIPGLGKRKIQALLSAFNDSFF